MNSSRIPLVALFLLAADQAAKPCVERWLPVDEEQMLWSGILILTHVPNVGVAMGWMEHLPEVGLVTSLASSLGLLLFSLSLPVHASRIPAALTAGLSCALGGAAGNTLDRLRLGYVIDFIGLPGGLVVNLADLMVVLGAMLVARPLWTAVEAPAACAPSSARSIASWRADR